jgi:hypothetical protein
VCYTTAEGCIDSGNNTNWKFIDGTGTIRGNAFYDTDGNGVKAGSEVTGLNSLSVSVTGTTSTGASFTASTTTAGTGSFIFTSVPRSNTSGYTVTLNSGTTPTGYIRTRFNSSGANILGTGSTVIVNFGYVSPSTGSGKVYIDANDNGRRDYGETTGISGATVTILGTTGTGGSLQRSGTTSSTGAYVFTWLPTSSGAFTFGVNTGTIPSGYRATSFTNTGVTISQGASATVANFGYYWYGTMSGSVFIDTDRDGIKDTGENQAYSGATITLTGTTASGGSLNLSARTTSTGAFIFTNVPYGTGAYTLTLSTPQGYDSTSSVTLSRTVSIGQHAPSAAFGVIQKVGYGRVTAFIWDDTDGDGVFEGSETTRLSGVSVTLTGTSSTGATINKSSTTGSSGTGTFVVPTSSSGGYLITLNGGAAPSTYLRTRFNASGANLVSSGTLLTIRFGYVSQSTISGTAFGDTDEDALIDAGETQRFSGATLTLSGTTGTGGSLNRTATTNASGAYSFGSMPTSSGTFLLVIDPPDGYTTTSSNSRSVAVGTGGQIKTQNFGYIETPVTDSGGDDDSNNDGGGNTASNQIGGSRRPYTPIIIRIDVPTPSAPEAPVTPVLPDVPVVVEVPTREDVLSSVTLTLQQKIREDRLLEQRPIDFTLEGSQVDLTTPVKIDRMQDRILDGLSDTSDIVTAPVKSARSAFEQLAYQLGQGTEQLNRAGDALVGSLQESSKTIVAMVTLMGIAGRDTITTVAQTLTDTTAFMDVSTRSTVAILFNGAAQISSTVTNGVIRPTTNTLVVASVFIDTSIRNTWEATTNTANRVAVGRALVAMASRVADGLNSGNAAIQNVRDDAGVLVRRVAFASGLWFTNEVSLPIGRGTLATQDAITSGAVQTQRIASNAITTAGSTIASGIETVGSAVSETAVIAMNETLHTVTDIGGAVGQGIADTSRMAWGDITAIGRTSTAVGSLAVRVASRSAATVMIAFDDSIRNSESAISGLAQRLSPRTTEHAAAPDQQPIAMRQYKTSLYKKDDKVVISSLHLAVLSSFGIPYRNTPVVFFSDPKIAVTDEEGIASFHDVEAGKHRLEIHVEGEEVETRDIILEPPSGLTFEEQQQLDVILPVINVLVEKESNWKLGPATWFTIGLLLLGNLGWGYMMWHGRRQRDHEMLRHLHIA